MAKTSGSGAVDTKMALLCSLLTDATPNEAKWIIRTVTANLRLGIADMTVLDALAIAYGGGKEARKLVERAYSISSDLGRVAEVVVEKGLDGIKNFQVIVFEPIRPMLAERLASPERNFREIRRQMHSRIQIRWRTGAGTQERWQSSVVFTSFRKHFQPVSRRG